MSEVVYAWCGQPLREHLEGVAQIVALDAEALERAAARTKDVFGCQLNVDALKREVLSSAARLAKAFGVEPRDAHALLAVAAYLHDVGKAAAAYQERLKAASARDPARCPAQLRGHEVLSAWLAWHLVYELLKSHGVAAEDAAAVVAAGVALHHSARRSIDDVLDDAKSAVIGPRDMERLAEAARGVERYWPWGLGDTLTFAAGRMKWEYLQTLDAALLKLRARLLKPVAVWGELVAYVIMIADNLDAALGREAGGQARLVLRPLLRCGT
jgi:CRISPR-associated endonuclease Cas3-HD